MKEIIIIGAGGMARDLFASLQATLKRDERIKGVLADDRQKFISSRLPTNYLGDIHAYEPKPLDRFLVCFGTQPTRADIYQMLQAKGARFHRFIHPTALIARNCHIAEGAIIGAYCVVGEQSVIGENVFANKFVSIGHDSTISNHTILCPYVMIAGGCSVGEASFLSTRVSLSPNTHIGKHCVISAHSFVKTNIADSTFAYPQTTLKQRRR